MSRYVAAAFFGQAVGFLIPPTPGAILGEPWMAAAWSVNVGLLFLIGPWIAGRWKVVRR